MAETDVDARPTAAPEGRGSETQALHLWRRFRDSSAWLLVVFAALFLVFAALAPDAFPTSGNMRNIALDASVLLVLSVGATFVIIAAGIDISVGSVLVFSAVVSAKVMAGMGGPEWVTGIVGLGSAVGAGMSWGLLHGILVARFDIPPLIVTLGTLGMALGLALLIAGGTDITDVPFGLVDTIGNGLVLGLPVLVLIAAAVALVAGLVLATTRFGRRVYAVGSNIEAARRAGVRVERYVIAVYALAGSLTGLGGYLSLVRFSTTSVSGHTTDALDAITSVILGGTSLFGGVGTIVGTLLGVLIPSLLQNGLVIAGLQPYWQDVAVGAVLIVAVYVDQLRRRARLK